MLKNRIRFVVLAATAFMLTSPAFSTEGNDKILQVVTEAKELIDTGQIHAAQDAFDALQADFPKVVRPDLDLFIQGEMHYAKTITPKRLNVLKKCSQSIPEAH